MRTADLDYDLPPDRIATHPAEPRDAARLLHAQRAADRLSHRHVHDLPALLHPGDVLVFNQSKVLPARFVGRRSATRGRVTGLYLGSPAPGQWQVMLEARGSLRVGETIALDDDAQLELLAARGNGEWLTQLHSAADTLAVLERLGEPPLPPYIRKARRARHEPEATPADRLRYNTVYATDPGSVAAPTAGLHFTDRLLAALDARGVQRVTLTLHVGLGTFAPVRSTTLAEHAMHSEWFRVPAATLAALYQARRENHRIIPVGTTSVRALESLPPDAAVAPPGGDVTGETRLFIRPADAGETPFAFRFTDALMTNFHLPRSTLLALVAALPGVGLARLKAWYAAAVADGYRFYSYGDAMLLE